MRTSFAGYEGSVTEPLTEPTEREIVVMEMIAQGFRQHDIADTITHQTGKHLSVDGVRMIIYKLCQKLGADNSYHLIAIGFRRGILK